MVNLNEFQHEELETFITVKGHARYLEVHRSSAFTARRVYELRWLGNSFFVESEVYYG